MSWISLIPSLLNFKIIGILILGVSLLFGMYKCNQIRKEKALIKHYSDKRDRKIEKEMEEENVIVQREKIEFEEKEVIKDLKKYHVYKDKQCILKYKELGIADEGIKKLCDDDKNKELQKKLEEELLKLKMRL